MIWSMEPLSQTAFLRLPRRLVCVPWSWAKVEGHLTEESEVALLRFSFFGRALSHSGLKMGQLLRHRQIRAGFAHCPLPVDMGTGPRVRLSVCTPDIRDPGMGSGRRPGPAKSCSPWYLGA